ncbi:MAG: IPExxxVDY family protein [Bacteroidales bacterium]
MAKKIKIEVDFSEDNVFIAISCQKKDHWLVLQLNHTFKMDLRRISDVGFYHWKRKEVLPFPVWYYPDHDRATDYYFISNSHPEGKLIPTLNTTDFFILINGNITGQALQQLIAGIRKIEGVLLVQVLDHHKVKDLDHLISDLELHMIEFFKS